MGVEWEGREVCKRDGKVVRGDERDERDVEGMGMWWEGCMR